MRCDVTDAEPVEAAFAQVEEAHGPVEVLVANAGITHDTLLLRMSEDDWSSVIETNLTGSFRLAKRAAKGMLRLRRGLLPGRSGGWVLPRHRGRLRIECGVGLSAERVAMVCATFPRNFSLHFLGLCSQIQIGC